MDNKKYKLIVFDFDGTLVDSFTDIGLSVNHALSVLGAKECARERFSLPDGAGERVLFVAEKVSHTPAAYPRGNGKERSRPL